MDGMVQIAGRAPRAVRRALRPRRAMALMDNLWGLAIVATVIVIVIGFGLLAQAHLRETRATALLTQLVQAVSTTFQSTRNYGSNTNLIPTLDGFGKLPGDFVVRSGGNVTLEHPFGGNVRIQGGPGGTSNTFRIRFTGLDNDVCAALAEKSAGKTRGRTGLAQVVVNGTALTLPYTVVQAAAACNGGSASNRIDWDYY